LIAGWAIDVGGVHRGPWSRTYHQGVTLSEFAAASWNGPPLGQRESGRVVDSRLEGCTFDRYTFIR